MRNRELATRKIEKVEGQLKTLIGLVNRGEQIDTFLRMIRETEEVLEDLKSIIQREPMSPEEGNGLY